MKGSDLIVRFLGERGVRHAFGYPGGMVTHLMDSLSRQDAVEPHVARHEQGAAFMACGYAQATGETGFAYATSGPGATNLVTGICHAWYDSVPVLFLTGQVNSSELRGDLPVRQRGFQETDIASMVSGVTKYASCVADPAALGAELERAWDAARSGRMGPVLLDVCMDVMRADVEGPAVRGAPPGPDGGAGSPGGLESVLAAALDGAERPVVLLGNGVKAAGASQAARRAVRALGAPAVTSMNAFDVLGPMEERLGFIGAYGHRAANFAVAKSDLVIAVGSRMDVRQVGARRGAFAPDARIVRVDVDAGELEYRVHPDEVGVLADAGAALRALEAASGKARGRFGGWLSSCARMQGMLSGLDSSPETDMVAALGRALPEGAVITADVGQNQVWIAQSVEPKDGQRFLFSGGHGAMGYSLPAAIGASLATGGKAVSFNGDGGIQMNLQELQTLASEGLPVKVVVLNNRSLGMIRHFQEMYFDGRYAQTVAGGGYDSPRFEDVARAYGLPYAQVSDAGAVDWSLFSGDGPALIEVVLPESTHVFPKLEFGKPNQDQEPLLPRDLYRRLMEI